MPPAPEALVEVVDHDDASDRRRRFGDLGEALPPLDPGCHVPLLLSHARSPQNDRGRPPPDAPLARDSPGERRRTQSMTTPVTGSSCSVTLASFSRRWSEGRWYRFFSATVFSRQKGSLRHTKRAPRPAMPPAWEALEQAVDHCDAAGDRRRRFGDLGEALSPLDPGRHVPLLLSHSRSPQQECIRPPDGAPWCGTSRASDAALRQWAAL